MSDTIFGTPSIDMSTILSQSNEGGNNENTAGNTAPGDTGYGDGTKQNNDVGSTVPGSNGHDGTESGKETNVGSDGDKSGNSDLAESHNNEPPQQKDSEVKDNQNLILGKYKTQDDLKKAYHSLARKIEVEFNLPYGQIKSISEDLVDDYQNLNIYYNQLKNKSKSNAAQTQQQHGQSNPQLEAEVQAQSQAQKQAEADEESRLIDWYNKEILSNPINANAVLANYIAEKRFKELSKQFAPLIQDKQQSVRLMNLKNTYPDMAEYSEQIAIEIEKIYEANPELISNQEAEADVIKDAYYRSKNNVLYEKVNELEKKLEQAFENGRQAGLKGIDAKKKINNEINTKQPDGDSLPHGINILPISDGIFF